MMSVESRSIAPVLCCLIVASAPARGEETKPYAGPACTRNLDDDFTEGVWPIVKLRDTLARLLGGRGVRLPFLAPPGLLPRRRGGCDRGPFEEVGESLELVTPEVVSP
jgi:hypothetical protein